MPWTPESARKHTHKAKSPKAQRQWSEVANSALSRGASEGSAIRQANAVVARRHAAGGAISPLASIAGDPMHMRSSLPHLGAPLGNAGRMRMPHVPLADTMHNIDQHMSGARVKLPTLKAKLGGRTTHRYGEGGSAPPKTSSSPGSPGAGGAIHDALAALRDYFITTPARRVQAAREERENQVVEGNAPGNFARGGRVHPKAMPALKKALTHLQNKDASSAAATLRASPEAMAHPTVARAAQSLRSSHGLGPATQALTALTGQNTPGVGGGDLSLG